MGRSQKGGDVKRVLSLVGVVLTRETHRPLPCRSALVPKGLVIVPLLNLAVVQQLLQHAPGGRRVAEFLVGDRL